MRPNLRFEPTGLPSVGLRLKRRSLAGPKNERSGPEKGRRAAKPDSGLWGRESGPAGLLTCAFSRQRSASLRSLRAAADAPIVSPLVTSRVCVKVKEQQCQKASSSL
jgi:hypothetical protein